MNMQELTTIDENITEPTIVDMRRFVFKQMQLLALGKISVHEATVQAKLAHQIMDGYKTQVRLLEIADLSSLRPKDIEVLTASMDSSHV